MADESPPRIPPLEEAARTGDARTLLDTVRLPGAGPELADANIFATLVRHPRLFRRWTAFGGVLLDGALPARHREILILRTGWRCRAPYEWGQHVLIGRRAGLGDGEITALARAEVTGFDGVEAALVAAADELHAWQRVSDATWATLAASYDERQLIEVPMVVGHYHLVAMTLNALRVPLDEGLPAFP